MALTSGPREAARKPASELQARAASTPPPPAGRQKPAPLAHLLALPSSILRRRLLVSAEWRASRRSATSGCLLAGWHLLAANCTRKCTRAPRVSGSSCCLCECECECEQKQEKERKQKKPIERVEGDSLLPCKSVGAAARAASVAAMKTATTTTKTTAPTKLASHSPREASGREQPAPEEPSGRENAKNQVEAELLVPISVGCGQRRAEDGTCKQTTVDSIAWRLVDARSGKPSGPLRSLDLLGGQLAANEALEAAVKQVSCSEPKALSPAS